MSRTILCPHCNSALNEDILKRRNSENICLVCGGSLLEDVESSAESEKEKTKWYYYKEGGGTLMNTVSTSFTPLYTFEAVDLEDAKEQLKEVMPNSPLLSNKTVPKVQCPYCFSTEVQLVPKKFSLLTGIMTNGFNRVCVRCQRKF